MIDAPGAIRLLEAGNLQMPAGEGSTLRARGGLRRRANRDRGMSLISSRVWAIGYGTATWPDTRLDLRLRSRATRRIPG